ILLSGENDGNPAQVLGTRIVNNEIVDFTDSIQLYRPNNATHAIDFGGTIIDENDLYLTDAIYSDCNGNLEPQGDCACAENAVDIKSAGTGSNNIVQVSNNRMWGFKDTDTACGGTGSWGPAAVIHQGSEYSLFQANKIWSCARGLSFTSSRHSVIDNVIYAIDNPYADQGYGLVLNGSSSEAYRNIIIDVRNWSTVTGADTDFRCNALLDAGNPGGTPGAGITADYNWYFNAGQLALPGDHDIVAAQASDAFHEDLCFWARRWTGPEQICIPRGAISGSSPHAGLCDPNLGSRPDVGIHDQPW
ncbi:MAG: hypothetical protein JRI68_19010, partial [Deltaproteobacteria bacterium]|nr:hypothetical protein [Deltaproteobacteria bacterium]